LSCMAHSLQEKVTVTSTSTFLNAINSYHRVNTLYDGTINCFSTLAQLSIASNETFSYNQALKQDNFCKFIKAVMVEVSDHESREHWTLITKHCHARRHKNDHEHLELQAHAVSRQNSQ
jgi:hypothetical protein